MTRLFVENVGSAGALVFTSVAAEASSAAELPLSTRSTPPLRRPFWTNQIVGTPCLATGSTDATPRIHNGASPTRR